MQLRLRECADRDISFLSYCLFYLDSAGRMGGWEKGVGGDIKIIDFAAPPTERYNKLLVGARTVEFIVRPTFAPLQVALSPNTHV